MIAFIRGLVVTDAATEEKVTVRRLENGNDWKAARRYDCRWIRLISGACMGVEDDETACAAIFSSHHLYSMVNKPHLSRFDRCSSLVL